MKKYDFEFINKFIFYVFIFLILAVTVWIYVESPSRGYFSSLGKNDVWFGEDWYYEDTVLSSKELLAVPAVSTHYLKLQAQQDIVRIIKVLDFTPSNEEYLCFRVKAPKVRVYVNGKMWYESVYREPYNTYAAEMYVLHQVSTKGMQEGDHVTIELSEVPQNKAVILQYLAVGDRYALSLYIMRKSKDSLFICLAAIFLIMFNLVTSFSFWLTGKSQDIKTLRWLDAFMVLAVIYLCTDCGCMEMFIENASIINWLNSLSLLMLPIPFVLFAQHAFFPNYMQYNVLAIVNYLLVAISVICYVFFAYNMTNFYMPIHVLIGIDTLACILSFWQEKMTPSREIFIGFGAIVVTAAASILGYWKSVIYPASIIFGYGFLTFSLCMLIWIVRNRYELNSMREEVTHVIMQRDKRAAEEASEQKSRFLSHMSHEIRTPLNAIIGMNELIMRDTDNEEIRKYANNIQRAGRTLLALVNDVLDFSKIETGKMSIIESEYSLSTILNDVVLMIKGRAEEKGLELRIDIDNSLPDLLRGDEIRIKQVMLNLMTNAVKYTPQGWLELAVRKKETVEFIDGENIILEIRVSDSGMGIKEEELSKLFVEFERLDQQKNKSIEGSGLGLSITSRLVGLMDGTISVESEYDKGSSFIVCIPQRVVSSMPIGDYKKRFGLWDGKEEKKGEDNSTGPVLYPSKSIFVVDDNEMNLEVIASILEMLEIHVERASSGQAAIDCLNKAAYDLILTDDMMPEISGTDLMLYLHEHAESVSHNTPIVVLTANAVAGAREEYIKKGFDDYMSKPIDIDVLQKILMKYLN